MRIRSFLAGLALILSACNPAQNWREVRFEGTTMRVQLPCKPDRTHREVPIGGAPVQLAVAGCASGDVLHVVMTTALASGADVQAALQGWQSVVLSHLKAQVTQKQNWQKTGMLSLTAAQQIQAQVRRSDGQVMQVDAVWGAWLEGDHVRVVHAAVYAPAVMQEHSQTLFDSISP